MTLSEVSACIVTNLAQVQSTMNKMVEDFGKLDVFIANAGAAVSKGILEQSHEEYYHQMRVNGAWRRRFRRRHTKES